MNIEEYKFYSNVAVNLFNFMNGKVNKINNNCILQIQPFDFNGTYGDHRPPNFINIYIENIIGLYNSDNVSSINRNDFICTCIALVIAHELSHADQYINGMKYKTNTNYYNNIESAANYNAYKFVFVNRKNLSNIGNFNCDVITNISMDGLNLDIDNYRRIDVAKFYIHTIKESIMDYGDKTNEVIDMVQGTPNVGLAFFDDNDVDVVLIKKTNKYVKENISIFSSMVYKWFGKFNNYSMNINVSMSNLEDYKNRLATIDFYVYDRTYNPIIFAK